MDYNSSKVSQLQYILFKIFSKNIIILIVIFPLILSSCKKETKINNEQILIIKIAQILNWTQDLNNRSAIIDEMHSMNVLNLRSSLLTEELYIILDPRAPINELRSMAEKIEVEADEQLKEFSNRCYKPLQVFSRPVNDDDIEFLNLQANDVVRNINLWISDWYDLNQRLKNGEVIYPPNQFEKLIQ